jgi:hypothetical protein
LQHTYDVAEASIPVVAKITASQASRMFVAGVGVMEEEVRVCVVNLCSVEFESREDGMLEILPRLYVTGLPSLQPIYLHLPTRAATC